MKASILLFILTLSTCFYSTAQRWGNNVGNHYWGIQIGLLANIGTHITQVGLKIQGYYRYKFTQINIGNQLRFVGYDLSQSPQYISQRINAGVVLLAGKQESNPQFILSGLNHQSKYNLGIAYNYLWYINRIGTSQKSGGFGLHIKQVSFIIENDIFAGQGRDRFRTSYAGLFYHNGLFNIGLNTILWTGETRNAPLKNPSHQFLIGYKDLSKMPFGKISHGILSISLDYQIFYGNTLSASIGIDDEHIRDILQNKLIHDKKFIPKKIRNPNPNYLMLDKKGMPVISPSQKVAPPQFYFQLGLNTSGTY